MNVPIRSVIVANPGGGINVINPLPPTKESISQVEELVGVHGEVKNILLTSTAVEHRGALGPFTQKYPNAVTHVVPGQWTFPVPLGLRETGVVSRNILTLLDGRLGGTGLEVKILGPLEFKSVGTYAEGAVYHRGTKSLFVTDSVASITSDPPKIIMVDRRPLLYHARDYSGEVVEDVEETWKKGWRRMVLFGLCFYPGKIDVTPFGKAIGDARRVPMKGLGKNAVPGDLYPWSWRGGDEANFKSFGDGGLFIPPILTKLIFDREPERVIRWAEDVGSGKWDFRRVVGAHFNNDVKAGPEEFVKAFDVLKGGEGKVMGEDLELLQKGSDLLTRFGVVGESKVCDGEEGRKFGRIKI